MSAALSYIIDQVLAQRVDNGFWSLMIGGEPSREPTRLLWGRGRNLAAASLLELESAVLQDFSQWRDGLARVVQLRSVKRGEHVMGKALGYPCVSLG